MKSTKYFALTEKGIISGNADDVRNKLRDVENVRKLHKISGGLPVSVSVQDFKNPDDYDNWKHCKQISDELDKVVSGDFKRCPCCNAEHDTVNAGDYFKCPDCGEVSAIDEWEEETLYDYFDDVLDIDYIVNYRKEYKACRILVAYGGPNIYIDTYCGEVSLFWWMDRASFPLSRDTMNAIDEWAEDYYNCM